MLFKELTPAVLKNRAFKSPDRNAGVIIAEIDYQHPIFRPFADPGQSDPSVARFYQYFTSQALAEELVLARFEDGNPAMLERKLGKGTVVLLTTSLDVEWSNLPVKAHFIPFLYRTLEYLAADRKGVKSYLVGNPVAIRSFADLDVDNTEVSVLLPDGEIEKPAASDIFFRSTYTPGIYQIERSEELLAYFAVNVDVQESDLTAAPEESIADITANIAGSDVQAAAISTEKMLTDREENQKLWRFVIAAVILLLLGETWLANRTYR
jgi:hypothetical protein